MKFPLFNAYDVILLRLVIWYQYNFVQQTMFDRVNAS